MRCSGGLPFAVRILPARFRPYAVLCAVILIHIPIGSPYIIGNLIPYIESYRHGVLHKTANAEEMSWFLPCLDVSACLFAILGGMFDRKYGPRAPIFCGSLLLTVSVAVTNYALKGGIWLTYFTYGVCAGAGIGLTYSTSLACAIRWLPSSKGLATGIVSAGFALSPLALNMIVTYYINPLNKSADLSVGNLMLFRNTGVLERTPKVFLLLAGLYAMCQLVGIIFVCNPEEVGHQIIEDGDREIKPMAAIRKQTLHAIFFMFVFNCFGFVFIISFYKTFGSLFIQDDHFLALTGALSSIANAAGRIVWGRLADRFSYQIAVVCASALEATLFFTIELSRFLKSETAFFISFNCTIFATSGNNILHALAIAELFGQKYFASNYALIMLGQIVAANVTAALVTGLLSVIHYSGFFFICGGLSTAAFVIAMFFHRTDRARQIANDEHELAVVEANANTQNEM